MKKGRASYDMFAGENDCLTFSRYFLDARETQRSRSLLWLAIETYFCHKTQVQPFPRPLGSETLLSIPRIIPWVSPSSHSWELVSADRLSQLWGKGERLVHHLSACCDRGAFGIGYLDLQRMQNALLCGSADLLWELSMMSSLVAAVTTAVFPMDTSKEPVIFQKSRTFVPHWLHHVH
jgi:hypothetical protein